MKSAGGLLWNLLLVLEIGICTLIRRLNSGKNVPNHKHFAVTFLWYGTCKWTSDCRNFFAAKYLRSYYPLEHQTSKYKEHSQVGLKNLKELFVQYEEQLILQLQSTLATPTPDKILNPIETSMTFQRKQWLWILKFWNNFCCSSSIKCQLTNNRSVHLSTKVRECTLSMYERGLEGFTNFSKNISYPRRP